jgi:uncharacterized protein (TIGR02118 family)
MIRVSALYGNTADARFDHDYYHGRHRKLVERLFGPHGMLRIEMDRGLAGGGGAAAPFVASAHLYFESLDAFQAAFAAHGEEVLADIPNYTNVTPVLQVSEIAAGAVTSSASPLPGSDRTTSTAGSERRPTRSCSSTPSAAARASAWRSATSARTSSRPRG